MRFRQSFAKVLLEYPPCVLKKQIDEGGRETTKAMDAGSLVDYVLFRRNDKYQEVDARYKSGPRMGEPAADWTCKEAREEAAEIRAAGLLPVLQCELDAAVAEAEPIRRRLDRLVADRPGSMLLEQPRMLWTSALGVECEGTPDAVIVEPAIDLTLVTVVDVKRTDQRYAKLQRQIYAMGWDVQAAAYEEGATQCESHFSGERVVYQGHIMLTVDGIAPPTARSLESSYLAVGRKRWEKAQRIWQECVDTDTWPGYTEEPIKPTHFITRTLEEYDPTSFAEEMTEP